MDVVIKIGERQKLALKRIVLRMSINPERTSTLEWQPKVIPERMSRDAFLCNCGKACVDLWGHLYRLINRLVRRRIFVGLIGRIVLIALITSISLVSFVSFVCR